jgi:hypothetical protein
VESDQDVGTHTSLSVDATDVVHISYYNSSNGNLKYVSGNIGAFATPETIQTSGNIGQYTSIITTNPDKIYISYYDSSQHSLKYARTIGVLSVSTTTYDFGVQEAGLSSTGLEITVTNIGSADLLNTIVSISDSVNFTINVNGGSNPCGMSPFMLSNGSSCTVESFFTPGSKGLFDTQLLFAADDSSALVALNGIGVQGPQDISPNPLSLDFGNTPVQSTPLHLQVDIYNFGTVDLSISRMTLSNQDQFSLDFDGGIKPCASQSPVLPGGDHCTFEVTFYRDTVGTFDSLLEIDSDDPDQPTASIPITGVVSEKSKINYDGTGREGCFIFEITSAMF